MDLDTYANLKASIINFSGRDDLSSVIDDFIDMAEAEMYGNKTQTLRTRDMESRNEYTLVTTDRYTALPDDFIAMRQIRIQIGDYEKPLNSATPGSLVIYPGQGVPNSFAVSGNIEFDITPDQAYTIEIQYYQKPTPLSSSNTTNSVLTNYPTVYLFGALWALYIFASEEEKAEYQYGKFMDAIYGANAEADAGRYGPAPALSTQGYVP